MVNRANLAFVVLICCLMCVSGAQIGSAQAAAGVDRPQQRSPKQKNGRSLNSDERLSVIAAALDSKTPRYSEHDCSHLVHAIYERAGFPYQYADSDDLYAGAAAFQRVKRPESGDLVVWPGHVGIVVRPSKHAFFSFLSRGPGVDDYEKPWWRSRGQPRFYRYIKYDACPRCVSVRDTPSVTR